MKKQIVTSLTTVALLLGFFIMPTYAEQSKPPVEPEKQIQLTESQKAELAEIYQDLMEEKKELIQKYVEFGVLSKEKGDKIIQKFEEHYKLAEKNGFTLPHHHGDHHHPQ